MKWSLPLLAACGSTHRPPVVTEPVTNKPPAVTRAEASAPRPVRWANIVTVDNCFYFSAPFSGRDEELRGAAELEVEGTRVQMRLASAKFEGSLDGDALEVRRVTTREHEGAWTVTETITGTVHAGELRARYRYEECGTEGCPGRCTMTADLAATVPIRRR